MIMRPLLGFALGALLAGVSAAPAFAQSLPSGSYQQSCRDIHVRDGMLIARCSAPNGDRIRSSYALGSCRGDIANVNGQLACNFGRDSRDRRDRRDRDHEDHDRDH